MIDRNDTAYPGETASAFAVLQLAHVYYNAALYAFKEAEGSARRIDSAPARFCAIHAIELYLNAFLRCEGLTAAEIRGRMHNVADQSFVDKLNLRKKTALHLQQLTQRREYLITRYAPDMQDQLTEVNRVLVTLGEVMMKAGNYVTHTLQKKFSDHVISPEGSP